MNQNYNRPNKFNNATNYMALQMPNVDRNHPNPIETLTVDELTYLQTYLEQLKANRAKQNNQREPQRLMPRGIASAEPQRQNRATEIYDPLCRDMPIDWRETRRQDQYNARQTLSPLEPGSRGAAATRIGKKTANDFEPSNYYNPYEYGARQDQFGQLNKPMVRGPYQNDPAMLNEMGVAGSCESYPSHIRNVNVESSLLQREATHLPGQREITEKEMDRFQLLPFNPQDTRHIVWSDMPRGGHPTRVDRLEL